MALLVRDLMTEDPVTLSPEDNATALWDLMDSRHIRHVPVVDSDGQLQGLCSSRDLMRGALAGSSDLPVSNRRDMLSDINVESFMVVDVESVEPTTPIVEAAALMLENKFGCLPVTLGGEVVGILTEADFVRFLADREAE